MITIFIPCDETSANYPDFSWQTYQVGEVIQEWEVVKTIEYRCTQLGCEPITLAFISQEMPTPENEWSCYQFPTQAIQVEVSQPPEPRLGFSFLFTDDLPVMGDRVPAEYVPMDDGEFPRMQRVDSDWVTTRYQTYHPQTNSPIPTIYLVWCEQLAAV